MSTLILSIWLTAWGLGHADRPPALIPVTAGRVLRLRRGFWGRA